MSTDAIPKIHAGKNRCTKRNVAIYSIVHYKGEPNLDSIMDWTQHRWRRQVWERSMTTKGALPLLATNPHDANSQLSYLN